MPAAYPLEFRRDVIAVARRGEQSRAQVARNFGISESCLARWLAIADREESGRSGRREPGSTPPAEGEVRELRRRLKQVEQENEILRRATPYFARGVLPE